MPYTNENMLFNNEYLLSEMTTIWWFTLSTNEKKVKGQQGWGQVQLTKYSSTPSTPNIYHVQVLVKYSLFLKVLKYTKYLHIKYKYKYSY